MICAMLWVFEYGGVVICGWGVVEGMSGWSCVLFDRLSPRCFVHVEAKFGNVVGRSWHCVYYLHVDRTSKTGNFQTHCFHRTSPSPLQTRFAGLGLTNRPTTKPKLPTPRPRAKKE